MMSFPRSISVIPFSLLTLLVSAGLWGPPAAQAQHPTAVTSVVNSAQDTTLEVNHAGGLLMPGKFANPGNYSAPNDSIPAEGAGTRLMWYPEKAAFRAGRVGRQSGKEDVWNAGNVGDHSVAFGVDTEASTFAAVAMGLGTTASQAAATALGRNTLASGTDATAMGQLTTASGLDATAMGHSTTATGQSSTALGDGSTASGRQSVAMGFNSVANDTATTAMGYSTLASGFAATAMGNETGASGDYAAAMGYWTDAATDRSLSIGECNSANRTDDGTLLVVGKGLCGPGILPSYSDAMWVNASGKMWVEGNVEATGHTIHSDRRLKRDIEPLEAGVLEKILKIDPVRFRFREAAGHSTREQIGLIAQEVRRQFPELVNEGSAEYLTLAYPKFSAVLLKGLQEQQSKIGEQQSTIDSLRDKIQHIETLEKRVAQLEAQSSRSVLAGLPGSWIWGGALLLLLLGGSLATLLQRAGQ